MSATAWVVVVVLVAVGLWAVAVYNRLVQLRNRIANAFGQIDVQLKRRYDLIPNLVEVARGYLAHEAATLEAVIKARSRRRARLQRCVPHRKAPAPWARWQRQRAYSAAAWAA